MLEAWQLPATVLPRHASQGPSGFLGGLGKAAVSHFTEEDAAPGAEVAFPGLRVAAMSRAGCPQKSCAAPECGPQPPGSEQSEDWTSIC